MLKYSSGRDYEAFKEKLGARPFFICDMDGCVMTGYSLTPGKTLTLEPSDNPEMQNIPFDLPALDLERLVRDGTLKHVIFADRPMDVRLAAPLVPILNEAVEHDECFRLGFLTSRSAHHSLALLTASGIDRPEAVTMSANNGTVLLIGGKETVVRRLTPAENLFLDGLESERPGLKFLIQSILSRHHLDPAMCPEPAICRREVGTNFTFNHILRRYDQAPESNIGLEIASALQDRLQTVIEKGPREADSRPTFRAVTQDNSIKVKISALDKGDGLEALAHQAVASFIPPTSIIFCGDAVAQQGKPGMDYFAMVRSPGLARRLGIPVLNVHVHHPVGNQCDGDYPSPVKSPYSLEPIYAVPQIDLRIANPAAMSALIANCLDPHKTSVPDVAWQIPGMGKRKLLGNEYT